MSSIGEAVLPMQPCRNSSELCSFLRHDNEENCFSAHAIHNMLRVHLCVYVHVCMHACMRVCVGLREVTREAYIKLRMRKRECLEKICILHDV